MSRLAAIVLSLSVRSPGSGTSRPRGHRGGWRIPAAVAAALVPSAALAHPGHQTGIAAGLLHPLSGADHLIAMVAVGLWAATMSGGARIALPVTFVSAMLVGAVAASAVGLGSVAGAVESMILASIFLLSVAVALAVRAPLSLAVAAVAAFGLAHGAAHGAEGSGIAFGLGMLAATAILHGVGLAFGLVVSSRLRRAAGVTGLVAAAVVGMAG